jgi:hypothetical protein
MMAGYLEGESARRDSAANLQWTEKDSGDEYDLTYTGASSWGRTGRLAGYACPHCGLIEIRVDPAKLNYLE